MISNDAVLMRALLSVLCHQLAALDRTLSALLSATPAVIHVVLATFFGTCDAYLSACIAEGGSILAADHHQLGGRETNKGTFHVELDTWSKHSDTIFLKTFGCTVFALCRTPDTCIDAALKSFLAHIYFVLR